MPSLPAAPFRVVSAFPGRIRIQSALRHEHKEVLQDLTASLSTLPAVLETQLVADANSVIIRYSFSQRELTAVLGDIETLISTVVSVPLLSENRESYAHPLHSRLPADPSAAPLSASSPPPRVAVMDSFSGRLRVRIPRLGRRKEVAARLENELIKESGIHSIETRPYEGFVIVRYDPSVYHPSGIVKLVDRLLPSAMLDQSDVAEVSLARDLLADEPQGPLSLLPSLIAIGLSILGAAPALASGALALSALPVARHALEGMLAGRFNVAQLDLSALIVLASRGDFLTGSIITGLIALGDYIRAKTMRYSRRAISELMQPSEQVAWMKNGDNVVSVPVNGLKSGDTVLVFPGDQIPMDGVVTQGQALVDQKSLTGEPLPVRKEAGDAVFALTMVVDGQISGRVEHIGNETRAGRVVEMIENAPLSNTSVQDYAAQLGDRLAGPLFVLAGATYLFTVNPFRMAAVLILDFASGIRIAAPTTILSAMTGAAKQGLFIKGGNAIEKLAQVDAVVFDKTGTLTRGEPFITALESFDASLPPTEVLRLAACAEANLKHPAAKAIVDEALKRGMGIVPPTQMDYAMGLGVQTVVEGKAIQVGSERYMRQTGIETAQAAALTERYLAEGNSLVYVAVEYQLIGLLAYSDLPRPESAAVLRALSDRGVQRIVMLTGDNVRSAQAVATELGITDVVAEAFPEQKADVVQSLRDQGYTVAVIGDGINDAPAFACADVGVSLQQGADVAKEMADVILLDGDLLGLPRAIDLSRTAMSILRQNINIVVIPTGLALGASIVGVATPLISTLVSHGTTIIAGLNALRPLFIRHRNSNQPLSD